MIKRLFTLALLATMSLGATAQQVDLRKKISLSGSAETEVTPDIIYISISLREYLKDGNAKKKVDINTLENELVNAVQKAGLPKESLMINNLSSWNNYYAKKKNPDFLISKQYRLKVGDLNKFNQIMGDLDAKGIMSSNIESYDYSKMDSLKKDLKIKALLNAKAKAQYMVDALGEKIGGILEIQDAGDNVFHPQVYRNYALKTMAADAMAEAAPAPEIDFKKIKLSFTVNTVFEIK